MVESDMMDEADQQYLQMYNPSDGQLLSHGNIPKLKSDKNHRIQSAVNTA